MTISTGLDFLANISLGFSIIPWLLIKEGSWPDSHALSHQLSSSSPLPSLTRGDELPSNISFSLTSLLPNFL